MKKYTLSTLTAEQLFDTDELVKKYTSYLKRVLGYGNFEASYVAAEMENPYDVEYITQEYVGYAEIDGIKYEVRRCCTDFVRCGLFHLADKKGFDFLMLIDITTMEDKTVGSYRRARKMYFR